MSSLIKTLAKPSLLKSDLDSQAAHVRSTALAAVFLRLALAAGFLSAVADRFGLWGPAGTPGVGWGGFDPFLAYTGQLLWFLPASLVPAAGWAATVLEVTLAVGLLAGVRVRAFALASGLLLTVFGVVMTVALGPEPPLSYSVWSAAAGAFLLASLQPAPAGAWLRLFLARNPNSKARNGVLAQELPRAPRGRFLCSVSFPGSCGPSFWS